MIKIPKPPTSHKKESSYLTPAFVPSDDDSSVNLSDGCSSPVVDETDPVVKVGYQPLERSVSTHF